MVPRNSGGHSAQITCTNSVPPFLSESSCSVHAFEERTSRMMPTGSVPSIWRCNQLQGGNGHFGKPFFRFDQRTHPGSKLSVVLFEVVVCRQLAHPAPGVRQFIGDGIEQIESLFTRCHHCKGKQADYCLSLRLQPLDAPTSRTQVPGGQRSRPQTAPGSSGSPRVLLP